MPDRYIQVHDSPPPGESIRLRDVDDREAIAQGDVAAAKWSVEKSDGTVVRMTTAQLWIAIATSSVLLPTYAVRVAYPVDAPFVFEGALYRVNVRIADTNTKTVAQLLEDDEIEKIADGENISRSEIERIATEKAEERYPDPEKEKLSGIEPDATQDQTPEEIRDALRSLGIDFDNEFVDMHDGLRPATAADYGKLGLGPDGILYRVRRTTNPGHDAAGNFNAYTHPNYRGVAHNRPPNPEAGQTYYNIRVHQWYLFFVNQVVATIDAQSISPTQALGANAVWLGEVSDEYQARHAVENFDNSHAYYAVYGETLYVLDNNTYSAATTETTYTYEWVELIPDSVVTTDELRVILADYIQRSELDNYVENSDLTPITEKISELETEIDSKVDDEDFYIDPEIGYARIDQLSGNWIFRFSHVPVKYENANRISVDWDGSPAVPKTIWDPDEEYILFSMISSIVDNIASNTLITDTVWEVRFTFYTVGPGQDDNLGTELVEIIINRDPAPTGDGGGDGITEAEATSIANARARARYSDAEKQDVAKIDAIETKADQNETNISSNDADIADLRRDLGNIPSGSADGTILYGTAVPEENLGKAGDTYFRRGTGIGVYEKTDATTWDFKYTVALHSAIGSAITSAFANYAVPDVTVYPNQIRLNVSEIERNWIIDLHEIYAPVTTANSVRISLAGVPIRVNNSITIPFSPGTVPHRIEFPIGNTDAQNIATTGRTGWLELEIRFYRDSQLLFTRIALVFIDSSTDPNIQIRALSERFGGKELLVKTGAFPYQVVNNANAALTDAIATNDTRFSNVALLANAANSNDDKYLSQFDRLLFEVYLLNASNAPLASTSFYMSYIQWSSIRAATTTPVSSSNQIDATVEDGRAVIHNWRTKDKPITPVDTSEGQVRTQLNLVEDNIRNWINSFRQIDHTIYVGRTGETNPRMLIAVKSHKLGIGLQVRGYH